MRRLVALLALLAPLAIPAGASAGGALTISGPEVGRFWSTVTVSGHTAAPDEHVLVYYRRIDRTTPTKSPVLTSGPDGAFTWSFRLARKTHYWATSAGQHSAVRTVSLVQATCTVSGPAFTKLPPYVRGSLQPPDPHDNFAAFTANRGTTWAGYGVDVFAGRYVVLRWTPGAAPRVLAQLHYTNIPETEPNGHGTVAIAGITPSGDVVAAVQDPSLPNEFRDLGWYWDHGVRHRLAMKTNWVAAWPLRVLDNGTIMGVARRTDGLRVLVSWASLTAYPRYLMDFAHRRPSVQIDTSGDAVWSPSDGSPDVVRLRDGTVRTLIMPDSDIGNIYVTAAGRYSVYGEWNGVVQGDLLHIPTSGPIFASPRTGFDGGNAVATAASRHGDFVVGANYTQHLRTSAGAWVTMPAELDDFDYPGQSFDDTGRLAYTSITDGLPHFLRCS